MKYSHALQNATICTGILQPRLCLLSTADLDVDHITNLVDDRITGLDDNHTTDLDDEVVGISSYRLIFPSKITWLPEDTELDRTNESATTLLLDHYAVVRQKLDLCSGARHLHIREKLHSDVYIST